MAFPVVAQDQDIGYEGPRFTGAGATPTESKPENKLWFNDGAWWGSLWSASTKSFRIHRLDFATHTWVDTGVAIDPRTNTHSDALWDGTKLYIASHVFSSEGGSSGNPMRIFRYDYDDDTDAYSLDPEFPVTVGDYSTEAMCLAKDSTGVLWAAWTQGVRVWICHTLAYDTLWSSPIILPRNTSDLRVDDICGIVSYGGDRIGILCPNAVADFTASTTTGAAPLVVDRGGETHPSSSTSPTTHTGTSPCAPGTSATAGQLDHVGCLEA